MACSTPNLPLIDEALGDELFALQEDAGTTLMQQQIWREVRKSIGPDLKQALRGPPENLKANLHRIRGYCSSCALRRLEKVLLVWEAQPDVIEAAQCYGPVALEATLLSIDAIESRYPHLSPVPADASQ
ncbi:MAG TPA: hypothetical protein VIS96_18585 [Terrimicrobiaceae bacterium]